MNHLSRLKNNPIKSFSFSVIFFIFLISTLLTVSCKKAPSKEKLNPTATPTPTTSPTAGPTPPTKLDPPLSPPIILVPTINPYISNSINLTISGTCVNGATVQIAGDYSSNAVCLESAFTFNIAKQADGIYNFSLTQKNINTIDSPSVSLEWHRDTLAPAAPIIFAPSATPYSSSDSSLLIQGNCETESRVDITGDHTDFTTCNDGLFTFSISKSTDSTYNFNINQTDLVFNKSQSTSFQWIRNSALPPTPIISAPGGSPYFSNSNSITLNGSCLNGNMVKLNTTTPAGTAPVTTTCSDSLFSFTINQVTDGNYNFQISQTELTSGLTSGNATFIWSRDTVEPLSPTITTPTISIFYSNNTSLIITGNCEIGAIVNIAGATTQSQSCSADGTYSFSIENETEGSFSYLLTQTDRAGNISLNKSQTWVRDLSPPAAPIITSPATQPFFSNLNSLTISGSCESNSTVNLIGDSSASIVCESLAFSFTVNQTSDGNFSFSITQTDLSGNTSPPANLSWYRDTVSPNAPSISSPNISPYTSADSTITAVGGCEPGATLNLNGDATATTNCIDGSYSIDITKNFDGTYNFSITQTDIAGNTSSNTQLQWIRNSSIPNTPEITTPTSNPWYSHENSLVISGNCSTFHTVELSGSDTQSMTCNSQSYSFTVANTNDGIYNYSVKQKNASNIYSGGASIQWVRDTVNPLPPSISNPLTTPYLSNTNSIDISGECETNSTVILSGDSNQTISCLNNNFSFSISKITDLSYSFTINQLDLAGNISGSSTIIWQRDTSEPLAPTITNPSTSTFTSSAATLFITGSCESQSTVLLQEYTNADRTIPYSTPLTTTCLLGAFNFAFSKTTETTYYIGIKQIDLAQNSSQESNLDWTRNTSFMDVPVISNGGIDVVGPIITNTSSILLRATCTQGTNNQILTSALNVSPSGSLSCASQSYGDFTISEATDGTYFYDFWQEDPATPNNSATVTIEWVKDTLAPNPPVILNPLTSPYTAPGILTLSGSCDTGNSITLSGDSTANTSCDSNAYSFTITKTTDGTYSFTVTQTDLANNSSTPSPLTWIRDSNSVQPPVISSPAANVINNSSSITLSGSCTNGYLLTLSGYADGTITTPTSGSANQTCNSGSFTYSVTKNTDGTLNFSLKQTFNSIDSAPATRSWVRDATVPIVTIATGPLASNLSSIANFTFSANETVSSFECKLDYAASYSPCSSPYSLTTITNGNRTLYIRATDLAGNVSTAATYNWSQQSFNALAIYHFDTTNATLNSSSYSGIYANTLNQIGTPGLISSGKFNQGRTLSSANYYYVVDNDSLDTTTKAITLEGYWQSFSSITSAASNTTWTLISKNGNASGSYGWELQLVKTAGNNTSNTKCILQIKLTSSNSTAPTIIAGGTKFACGSSTTSWNYFAVTWSAAANGAIKFFGTPTGSTTFTNMGTGTFGTASTLLGTNSVNIKFGNGGSGTAFPGGIDEVRISQTARNITAVPTSAFSAD
jgi:hypothetical protein